ncbi:hypothetical protein CDQ84_17345 [Clostridium thermosuccinogenes]|uniref:Uncharacterized protein n=1 Tax=Clostridium thermosuccinogenes TaxID=84032 RepID=A0A2K2F916_9CLOT|nr:hypothetical protein CDO33_08795 [Pseudoclostridium thermosuccinogenes]PNT94729.1 hypothetical protein CDQ85_17245 [Pseudoclostridium thermosuccinogenes]PNT95289.1 hypothetical protein CDQ84_17345 [Pseudoclostridium thermosuccinogenes]
MRSAAPAEILYNGKKVPIVMELGFLWIGLFTLRVLIEYCKKRVFTIYKGTTIKKIQGKIFAAINIHLNAWIKHLGILPCDLNLVV